MREQSRDLSTGVSLPFVENGNPDGVPVLMLHGITDSWHSFELVLPHLPNWIRAIAVTQRGHGNASRPDSGYTTRHYAVDVAALADELGIERAIVVGHSMGSTNAMRFAIDFPDRTLGVVLMAPFASFSDKDEIHQFIRQEIDPLQDPIDRSVAREFQLSTLAKPIPPDYLELVIDESLKLPARVWKAAFNGLMTDDYAANTHKIKSPTLIVWGDRDAYCPRADQDRLLGAISGSRLIAYEGAGHALHWEEPERFARDLVSFVNEISNN
jgi:non-heme chloroperoxidase